MPKEDFNGVDTSGTVKRIDYNNCGAKGNNNNLKSNLSVEEHGFALDPQETTGNFLTDLEGKDPQEITK
ncbi:hypothetical protein [Priestia megaterium]|uniref:hypothetical protein n=1 Tax=Priestia megaterium TaxID=1404 RepID=UPI001BE88670|nr:hypothetical protein [Priestia megaterium]MBT2259649.1 hypothetical protein [Priestia megaterium]MBT2280909.1 hypothetical protein [Priestia megaterium]